LLKHVIERMEKRERRSPPKQRRERAACRTGTGLPTRRRKDRARRLAGPEGAARCEGDCRRSRQEGRRRGGDRRAWLPDGRVRWKRGECEAARMVQSAALASRIRKHEVEAVHEAVRETG
jgi:hypothetical protein